MDQQERHVLVLQARASPISRTPRWRPKGKPGPEELALLEPFRGKVPDEVFGEAYLPPVSDGSGSDRALLQARQRTAARGRLQARRRRAETAERPAVRDRISRFLRGPPAASRRRCEQNLQKLGIDAHSRIVDAAQYKSAHRQFRFRRHRPRAFGGATTPGSELRIFFGSKAADHAGLAQSRRHRRSRRRCAGREDRQGASRAPSSTPPAARSTACCAPAAIGCRCGINDDVWSPIGTRSRGPSASPSSAPARPTPGGGTRRRRRRSGL